MQSNRFVGLVLVIVLVIGAAVAWQLSDGEPPAAPEAGPANQAPIEPVRSEEATVESATADVDHLPVVREAVMTDPAASDLPSVVGQVVGPDEHPLADAEVLCVPGVAFMPDFDNFDPDDTDLFEPQAVAKRMRRQARDRVTVRTDQDGRFRVRVAGSSRTVSLRVVARGHLVLDRSLPRPTDRDTDLGLLTLQAGAIIAGRVLDAAGNAVEGARVSRMLAIESSLGGMDFNFPGRESMDNLRTGDSSVTDATGRFELAHVEAGDFTLRARHRDHPTATRSDLTVRKGQSLENILVTMHRGAEIRGIVSGIPDGVSGLGVMAAAKPKATNDPTAGFMGMLGDASELLGDMGMAFSERQCDIASDGAFVLRGLAADRTYRLWVGQEGRGFAGSGVSSKRVEAAADSVGVQLRYEPGVTVTFVVVDASTDEPIERLWVRDQLRGGGGFGDLMAFAPGSTREKPYPEGKVTVANLRPKKEQKLRLTIDAIGHARLQHDDITLPESGNLDLGTLRLEPRPVLQVTVLTAAADKPLAGARVRLHEQEQGGRNPFGRLAQMGRGSSPQSGQTDSAGRCTLNAIDEAVGTLEITRRGYAPASADVEVATGNVNQQVVRLVVGGSAEVTVLGPDQKPIQDASVEHRTPTGDTDRRRSDANGLARFANLAPGSHGFRIAKSRGGLDFAAQFARRSGGEDEAAQTWQNLEVVNLEAATLSLEKSPTATLSGIVRENGVPLASATVAFRDGQASDGPDAIAADVMNSMMGQMGRGTRRRVKSGADGVYELKELPSGAHSLRITHRGRAMPSTVVVTLRDGHNHFDIDLAMTTLRGVVRDSRGNPVDGARVTVSQKRAGGDAQGRQIGRMMASIMPGMGLGGSTQKTDANGAFELRGVDADVLLEVTATAKGLAPTTVEATVALGQTLTSVELRMGSAGRIEVTIAKPGMFAAVQAEFRGPDAESVPPVMQVLRRGKGTLEGLRPGTWEVTYRGMNARNGQPAPTRTVEVLAGQTATVDF